MTTIIAVIFTVIATLANVLWFFIVGRLCRWTKDDIVCDNPYDQKVIQIKIERLLSMYDNMFKA